MTGRLRITRRRASGLLAVGLLLAFLAPLTACGKKGSPKPPEGKEPTYPVKYPRR